MQKFSFQSSIFSYMWIQSYLIVSQDKPLQMVPAQTIVHQVFYLVVQINTMSDSVA